MHAFSAVLYFILIMFHALTSGSLHLLAAELLQPRTYNRQPVSALLKGTYENVGRTFLFKFWIPDLTAVTV